MSSTKAIVYVALAAATAMLVQKLARDYLTHEIRNYLFFKLRDSIACFSNELTLVIEEYDDGLNLNKLFEAAKLYLEPKVLHNVKRIKITLPRGETKVSLYVKDEEIVDTFNAVRLTWRFLSRKVPSKVVRDSKDICPTIQNEVKFLS
ncbi:hypothetical protein Patl1_36470 [Pistacia atlantica]|nr:hypothetical protein Patl1_36470 [Pistacia atlantica]